MTTSLSLSVTFVSQIVSKLCHMINTLCNMVFPTGPEVRTGPIFLWSRLLVRTKKIWNGPNFSGPDFWSEPNKSGPVQIFCGPDFCGLDFSGPDFWPKNLEHQPVRTKFLKLNRKFGPRTGSGPNPDQWLGKPCSVINTCLHL